MMVLFFLFFLNQMARPFAVFKVKKAFKMSFSQEGYLISFYLFRNMFSGINTDQLELSIFILFIKK